MDAHDYRSVAYTYAWWLTGDEQAAGAAVRAAVDSPAVLAAAGAERLPALLAAVRATTGPTPSMCPASEVALLHDAHGLDLDAVAGLAAVDRADVRTELAHGRLEALTETVIDPFEHPERLGGLAVGNPADVAHARQCTSCAQTRDLLERGRTELRELAAVPVPEDLAAPATPATPARTGSSRTGSSRTGSSRTRPSGARVAAVAALLVVAAVAIVLLLLGRGDTAGDSAGGGDDAPTAVGTVGPPGSPAHAGEPEPAPSPTGDAAPSPEPDAGDPDPTEPDPTEPDAAEPGAAPLPVPAPDPGVFAVESAGLVGPASEPQQSGAVLPPTEPLRLAVRYRGAPEGVTLTGRWTVDGAPFRELAVDLTVPATTHIFGAPAPPEGWPAGTHEVYLSADGSVVAVVTFTVA